MNLVGLAFQLQFAASVFFVLEVSVFFFFCHDLCHAILGKCIYFFAFCLCYMGVQICNNFNNENKMWDIGKGTYLVVGNSGNSETYGTTTS